MTAVGDDLDIIGLNVNTPRKSAVAAIMTATLPATTGVIIPATTDFISNANGLRYRPTAQVTSVGGVATLHLQCVQSGALGSLDVGDTFAMSSQIAGATTEATVTVIDTLGIDKESDTDYRPRVLFAQRAITGAANATDHKIWSEGVTGVKTCFPYSGRPIDAGVSYPGDRTVYIESTVDVDADGLAPAWLLALVRTAIVYNISGMSQVPLGITDATLWTRSITRTTMYVEVRDLVVDADKDAACRAGILTACTNYFAMIKPFVDGVDLPQERTDTITAMALGLIVQDVLSAYGAYATSIGFGMAPGVFVSTYILGQGERTKIGAVAYA
jgi:hypothetical protein